ncbi:hypothetical protein FPRO04_12311 [Fusarium proliferatum]|nr:hypothetical protein FPRO04_12311 [Fusarium proliferatum]
MNQESASEARYLQFFIRCYKEGIEHKTGFRPESSLLEHLLNDGNFYQGRIYAYSNSLGGFKHKIGAMLWEAMWINPKDYIVLCNIIETSNYPLEKSCTALDELSSDSSLKENWSHIEWANPEGFVLDNIHHYLSEYHKYLEKNKEDDFWSIKPSKLDGIYPIEYGLMIYMTDQCAKIAWGHPNQTTNLPFTYTQASGQQSDRISLQRETSREEVRSMNGTDKAQDMYQNLSEIWRIEFPSDFDVTDENKQQILGCKGSGISIDWAKIFDDYPPQSEIWTGKEVNLWWQIIVVRVIFVLYG